MNLIHKLEPLWWMVFGAGGYVVALVLPGLLLGVGVFGALGAFETGLAYERVYGLAAGGLGKTLLSVFFILTFWHCCHHLRHLILDLAGEKAAAFAAYFSYTVALLATIATVGVVGGL